MCWCRRAEPFFRCVLLYTLKSCFSFRILPEGAAVVIVVERPPQSATCIAAPLTAFMQLKKDPSGPPLFAQSFLAPLTAASLSIISSQQATTSAGAPEIGFITSPQSTVQVSRGRLS